MSFISIKKLYFSYKTKDLDIPIFKSFSLDIEKGEFIAIKGPSGSGKSTLLYLIAGLLRFDKGEVLFDGQDVSKMKDIDLSFLRNKNLSFIFQQFHLLPKTSVLENILLPRIYPIEEVKKNLQYSMSAEQIAKKLGIGDRLDHEPSQLSGGQQQRVAIARALINDPQVILADEPTGNLDSKSTSQIIDILQDLNSEGKTIVLITHDDEVAKAASKIYHLRDGCLVVESDQSGKTVKDKQNSSNEWRTNFDKSPLNYLNMFPLVLKNAFRNKSRSLLTMLGITVGVAAVCSMITLGNFTKDKILDSYSDLGVNTIIFNGNQNWNLKATDEFPVRFQYFNWKKELLPLKKIFSDIRLISPSMNSWNTTVSFSGKSVENDPRLVGISKDGLELKGRELLAGRGITNFHVTQRHSVCVIGYDIAKRLFLAMSAIGQIIHVSQDESSFACKVIGVLKSKTSNKDWEKPNLQVFIPFTVFQANSQHWYSAQINRVIIQLKKGADVEKVGAAIHHFFDLKYGTSGSFGVDSDSVLVAQMRKFLTLFSLLLSAIAIVTLGVGGIGIANMMLVSVSERLKEIGIRKSVGATHTSIRYQFLLESILLCSIAGIMGIVIGVAVYQSAIYGASELIEKLKYEWVVDWFAMILSLVSIIIVGIVSGIVPAIKAEKLQVIDALRSE